MSLLSDMVRLANIESPGVPITVQPPAPPPEEPALPEFHVLSRAKQEEIAAYFLEQQELAVFKEYVKVVANRSSKNATALTELRGSLAREIRGLENLRREFEGPEGYGPED